MTAKRKPFKLGTAGVVLILLAAGIATTFSVRALMAEGIFSQSAYAASLAVAKKKAKAKKPAAKKKSVAKPAAKPAAAPAPSGPPAVAVHATDFVLKCGINGSKTLKTSDNPEYRDLLRYNCISDDLTSMWKAEFTNAATYPDAEIQKKTGAKPLVLETNKNNGSVKYRYNFSGNAFLRAQGDRFEGDAKCWNIDMWDNRKGGGAGGKKWSISDVNQGGSSDDCADRMPPPPDPAANPVPIASVGDAVSDHTVDFTLKCPGKDIVLQFVDTPEQVKDGIWQLEEKRKECVQLTLDAWKADFKHSPGKTYPETLMKQRFGVSPVAYIDTFYDPAIKMWKYHFSGDQILKAYGDKFAPADQDSGIKGPPCYSSTLSDGRALSKIAASDIVGIWITSWRKNNTFGPSCTQ